MSSISVTVFSLVVLFSFYKRFLSIEMLPVIYFFTTGSQSCILPAATKAHFICSKIIGTGISLIRYTIQALSFLRVRFQADFLRSVLCLSLICTVFSHSQDVQTMASNFFFVWWIQSSFIIFQMIDFHFFFGNERSSFLILIRMNFLARDELSFRMEILWRYTFEWWTSFPLDNKPAWPMLRSTQNGIRISLYHRSSMVDEYKIRIL